MFKNSLLIIIYASISSFALAQNKKPLYEGIIPNHIDKERSYEPEAHYFVYKPAEQKRNGRAVLVIPGGGYAHIAIDHEGHEVAKQLIQKGYTAFVLRYRLPSDSTMEDKKTGPLQDAQTAILKIRKEYGFPVVGVLGFSAGGHLAGTLATLYDQPLIQKALPEEVKPDFAALLYPVITMDSVLTHKGSRNNLLGQEPTEEEVQHYSVHKNIQKTTPPMFIMHAKDDKVVPYENSELLIQQLEKYQVPHHFFSYEKGKHGFGMHNKEEPKSWFDAFLHWLDDLPL